MANVTGDSSAKEVPAIFGENTATGGEAIRGTSKAGNAVLGISESGIGIWGGSKSSSGAGGMSETGIGVHSVSKVGPGVRGDTESGDGVFGSCRAGIGVHGMSETGVGVRGDCDTFQGVFGRSNQNAGVVGESTHLHGVYGVCHNPHGGGVFGTNDAGGFGLQGHCQSGIAVVGHSETGEGMRGETRSPTVAAIAAFNLNPAGTGAAVFAKKEGEVGHAGFFEGHVHISRKLSVREDVVLQNADCAEDFNIGLELTVEPGTVMVLGEDGALFPSQHAYDKRVAGVVSGAGNYRPAIVLDKQPSDRNRQPIALVGKVYCNVDASYGAIAAGDLLTTSPTPGHAMKADDPVKAFGAIIGKALQPLKNGQGLLPMLVALQ
jgi:hypothetical protein